uniref:Uncharacterized protein n=1 Tax=Populus trichocarpa TaxID=3694 RepID=A0A2K2AN83_POPTR
MNKYNATITQINTKIFTWKTRCGKNHGTGVHLKTSTITNNGFTIVLPQIQLRATTYISSRITYSRITTRLKENYLRKTHNTDSPVFCQNGQLPHHQSSIQPSRMKRNVSRSCCQNLSPIQRILYTLEESIESTIQERDLEKREEGEMFEMNAALKLVAA